MAGETSRIREFVLPYIQPGMIGIDIGYGGDCLSPSTISMDSPQRYAHMGNDPQQLSGDARDLSWFRDGVLDYEYSSHLLEDFPPSETVSVLREWLRVLKPGGLLILYLPNEQRFRAVCDATGQEYNHSHKCMDMSLGYMRHMLLGLGLTIEFERDERDGYSFLIIARKP